MKPKLAIYRIRIGAHLDPQWSEWFEGLEITYAEDGDTFLTGEVKDQAMLYGVLAKLQTLDLPLVSLLCVRHLSDVNQPSDSYPQSKGEEYEA